MKSGRYLQVTSATPYIGLAFDGMGMAASVSSGVFLILNETPDGYQVKTQSWFLGEQELFVPKSMDGFFIRVVDEPESTDFPIWLVIMLAIACMILIGTFVAIAPK